MIRRYGIALICVAAAFASTFVVQRLFPYPFLYLLFAAVMASAWFGGTGPGLFAVVAATLLADYFFLPPFYTFVIRPMDVTYFVAFIICAAAASWVSSSLKRAEEALREARNQLERRVAERTAELENSLAELREKEHQRLLLETEKSQLSDRLESRKVIERAKGILQRDLNISEQEAYRTLQRESQQTRKSMREIAESIILNEQLKRGS